MKKAGRFAVILILVIALAAVSLSLLSSCNKPAETEIAVISDIHVMAEEQIGDAASQSFLDKDAQSQKMLYISNAIFRTALDRIEESGVKALLIAGDLTEDGAKISHQAIANELKKLEEKGVEVFVINGNHDIRNNAKSYVNDVAENIDNVTPEDFKEIYADFGYAQALATYEGTLSYTADIGKNYRLIAIDAAHYTPAEDGGVKDRNVPKMTDGLIDWAAEQVKLAKEDKRTPLGMMHFPLMQHFGDFVDTIGIAENGKVNKADKLAAALTKAGLNYIFTGHVHTQDISAYKDDSGTLYDVMTGCLVNYPSPIRYLGSDKKSVTLTTKVLEAVDPDYIPGYASKDADALINRYQAFASNFADTDMITKLLGKLSLEMYTSLLSAVGMQNAETLAPTVRLFANKIVEDFLRMKIYGSSNSLEAIASSYGVTLPESSYKNVMAVAMALIKKTYAGDENMNADMTEVKLLKYSVYAIFDYLGGMYGSITNLLGEGLLPDIDLKVAAESLFKTGELDVVALNIGGLLSSALSGFLDTELSDDPHEILDALSKYDFGKKLLGMELQHYFDAQDGTIRIDALLDYFLFDFAKDNLTVDAKPGDNNIRVNKKTLEAENL